MRSFEDILSLAAGRKGGVAAVMAGIPVPKSPEVLAATADSDWLATMAKGIFQAGISWTVVDNKWPGIQEAFHGFDINTVTFQPPDWWQDLCDDPRIIRSPPKVQAILHNAAMIRGVRETHGSFGRFVADWPGDDLAGLLIWMGAEGERLGGNTGPYVLRQMGKDGYVLSPDVVARLVEEGVIDKAPTSKKGWASVQAAFNQWQAESGLPLTTISRVLAQSIGETHV